MENADGSGELSRCGIDEQYTARSSDVGERVLERSKSLHLPSVLTINSFCDSETTRGLAGGLIIINFPRTSDQPNEFCIYNITGFKKSPIEECHEH